MSILNFSKGKSGPWPTIILVIITAALTLLLASQVRQCKKPTPTGQAPDSLIHSINKAGDNVTSLRGTVEDFGIQQRRITDSISKVYGAKFKELKEYMIAVLQTKAEVPVVIGSTQYDYMPPVVINQDTCPPQIHNIRADFESPYYFARAQLGEDPYLKIIGFDTLTAVWRDTTMGRFLRKKTYLQFDISLANPDTRVTGIKTYRVPAPKPKTWSFGIQFGYGVTVSPTTRRLTPGPYVGIGFTKGLIRF